MNKRFSKISLAALALTGALWATQPAVAQVARGTTTSGVSGNDAAQPADGRSVKKTLMGKAIYNDAGQKVGKIEDLIISPDKKLTHVIVGAGGFLGMGRHDVAFAVSEIQDQSGKLVMAGATKDMVKGMPTFTYASSTPDTSKRDAFLAAADNDIAKGKAKLTELEKKAGAGAADVKIRINTEITALKADVTSAEAKLAEMKKATAARWKEFEADVGAATAKLRKSTDTTSG